MTLEYTIEQLNLQLVKLSDAVTTLNATLQTGINVDAVKETVVKVESKTKSKTVIEDVIPKNNVVTVTVEDLKAACIKASRSTTENAKARVKALLAKYGAKVVKDVLEKDRVVIFELLESEKF